MSLEFRILREKYYYYNLKSIPATMAEKLKH